MRSAAVGPLLAWTPRRSEGLGLGVEDGCFMRGWPVARGPLHQMEHTTLMLGSYSVPFSENVHNKLQVMHGKMHPLQHSNPSHCHTSRLCMFCSQ